MSDTEVRFEGWFNANYFTADPIAKASMKAAYAAGSDSRQLTQEPEIVVDLVKQEMRTINHFSLGGKSPEQEQRYTILEKWLAGSDSRQPVKPTEEDFEVAKDRVHAEIMAVIGDREAFKTGWLVGLIAEEIARLKHAGSDSQREAPQQCQSCNGADGEGHDFDCPEAQE